MPSAPYRITGIQAGFKQGGPLPVRREIDEWWFSKDSNDVNQRSLFIYALHEFQARGLDKNDDLSYLSIAGIHGLPVQSWPQNVGPEEGKDKPPFYCAHSRQTFATWHTPYMLLYEQRLWEEMRSLIPKYFNVSDHAELFHAADTWRLPFWDWAKKKPVWNDKNQDDPKNLVPGDGRNVPYVITQEFVQVRAGDGSSKSVRNPMFNFSVGEKKQFGDYGVRDVKNPDGAYVGKCRVTSRWPSTYFQNDPRFEDEYVNGKKQDYKKITGQLSGPVTNRKKTYFANSLPDAVYRLLKTTKKPGVPAMPFETFATTQWQYGSDPSSYPSLEGIHNNIHNFSGGDGYLGDPATSAFDPLFWVHHCNVDRILAIWQELYPNAYKTWLGIGKQPNGTDDNSDTKLLPFVDANGDFYTSKTCSYKFQEFGYTYPELQPWNYKDQDTYIKSINASIERLYSTTSKAALLLPQNAEVARTQMAAMTLKNIEVENFPSPLVAQVQSNSAAASLDLFGEPQHMTWNNTDYVANVVYERFALDGEPYSITIFLGDVPQDTGAFDFAEDVTAVGRVYNFSSPAEMRGVDGSGCDNCKTQQEERALATGQVILTDSLIQHIYQGEAQRGLTLRSLDRDEVIPYLQANLHWRISDRLNNIVLKEDPRMELLKVSVATAEATHFSQVDVLSQYSDYDVLYEVTEGRRAGAAPGDL